MFQECALCGCSARACLPDRLCLVCSCSVRIQVCVFFEVSVCLQCFCLFWGLDVDLLEGRPLGAWWSDPDKVGHLLIVKLE